MMDDDEITINGRTYTVKTKYDTDAGPPWEEEDGHGIVTEWTRRDKHPGERVLITDSHGYDRRYYDVAATMRIARRDGWGVGPDCIAALRQRLGRAPTAGQLLAAAVDLDYDYLRGWCRDDWCYVGVIVTELESGEEASLWRVDDCNDDYVWQVARELAGEIDDELERAAAATRRRDIMNITRALVR
jgi:hypothetical protein